MSTDPALTSAAASVAARFVLPAPVSGIDAIERGHINATFRITCGGQAFALQRLNTHVFPAPEVVLENRLRLQVQAELADDLLVPPLLPTRTGSLWLREPDGVAAGIWRLCPWMAGACHDVLPDQRHAAAAGAAFARFHALTSAIRPDSLREPIPGFLDLQHRLRQFDRALQRDTHGRRADCSAEVRAIDVRRSLASALADQPLRVVHADCKVNNLVFGADGTVVAVLDLDTLMPGHRVLDVADLLRSACAARAEDDTGNNAPPLREDLFAAVVEGYAVAAGRARWATLADAVVPGMAYMTLMLGVRFLTDHLDGDSYFRPPRPGMNLARARGCLRLLHAIEQRREQLDTLVAAAAR